MGPTINYFSMLRLTLMGLKSRLTPARPTHRSYQADRAACLYRPIVRPALHLRFTVPVSRHSVSLAPLLTMASDDTPVPAVLSQGVPMLKISSRKIKQVIFRLRDGIISWSSKKDNAVSINEIRDLRLGQPPTDTYNSSRWITVVYVRGQQWKVLHMVALTDDIYALWVQTLKALVSVTTDRHVSDVTPADPDLIWIRQLWPVNDKVIDTSKAERLCQQIGLKIPEAVASRYQGEMNMATFHQLIKDCQTRPEINKIYDRLCKDGKLDRVRVERFLRESQQLNHIEGIFAKYERDGVWTVASLTDFLCSSDNATQMPQDMNQPIQHYFVSSSHNTYLVGEQWRGESTVEGYIRVLLAGCRCVEMDVQTGDYEPVVYHRKTLTTRVSVRDICRAINTYGFVASPYPIIISAEIHCSTEQQNRLAAILKEVFGDRLVTAPLYLDHAELPSPEQLKHRIMFKAKPPRVEPQSPRLEPLMSPDSTSSAESDSGFARLARRLSIQGKSDRPEGFSPQLADLLVYTAGVKYAGFSKLNEYTFREQFSVSEKTANRIVRENQADWIKHNFSHISRVYPRGTRLTSSNYDPTVAWSAGCQLVALNWQTLDEGALYNHAMFQGGNGYILKPLALRQKVQEAPRLYVVRVHIICGQRMPLAPDLYVEATLKPSTSSSRSSSSSSSSGSSVPSSPNYSRTRSVAGVTLNPSFDEIVKFELFTTPSDLILKFIHLEVRNKSGLLAQWIRPVALAPKGYHHLPLYDAMLSRYVFATLFTKISVEAL
ncbi:hypothetical protein IAU60_002861 [Kwoniella sp. DSM 27419]